MRGRLIQSRGQVRALIRVSGRVSDESSIKKCGDDSLAYWLGGHVDVGAAQSKSRPCAVTADRVWTEKL